MQELSMILISLTAMAATISGPTPLNQRDWFSHEDVPYTRMVDGRIYSVRYSVTVDPTGKVGECRVTISRGMRDADALACRRLRTKGRFSPARNAQGTPVYGVFRSNMQFYTTTARADTRPRAIQPDLVLSVNKLPAV
jgi:TonB family protein